MQRLRFTPFAAPTIFYIAFVLYLPLSAQKTWHPAGGELGTKVLFLQPIDTMLYAGFGGYGLYKTADMGGKWSDCPGLKISYPTGLVKKDSFLFISDLYDGVFRQKLGDDTTWTWVSDGMKRQDVWSIAKQDSLLLAGTSQGLFTSFDNGATWAEAKLPSPIGHNQVIFSLLSATSGLYAGTDKAVLRSTDGGATWAIDSLGSRFGVLCLTEHEGKVYAGASGDGIFVYESGSGWSPVAELGNAKEAAHVNALIFTDTAFQKSAEIGGVFEADLEMNEGLPSPNTSCMVLHNGSLFAGTFQHGVWKLDLDGHRPGPRSAPTHAPDSAAAATPFSATLDIAPNPATDRCMVRFEINASSQVRVELLDSRGRLSAVPVDGFFGLGQHERFVDLRTLQAGIYHCVLQTPQKVVSREFVISKR